MSRILAIGMVAATLLGAAFGSARAAEPLVLRIAYEDKEQFPNYLGASTAIDPDKPGVSVELVKMVGAALGLEIKLSRMPWPRCLSGLQKGEVDAIFNSSFKEERLINGAYPMKDGKLDSHRRITTISYFLYRQKGAAIGWDGKAFANLTGVIGAPLGYSIVGDLNKLGVKVEETPDTSGNFKKLRLGRLAGVAAQDVTADQILKKGGFADIEKVAPSISTKDYFVMISHPFLEAHRDVAEAFWTKLGEIRDAKSEELVHRYAEPVN
ncbi:Transporter substrate-binding domain-containing protein [Azospirillaceae bacterium]